MSVQVRYSCVTDNKPKYNRQAALWADTLIKFGGASAEELVVHVTEPMDANFERRFGELGVRVEVIDKFDDRHAHSNKLQQLVSPALRGAALVVLCDCDLAFANPVLPRLDQDAEVQGKTVDMPNPPKSLWLEIFREASMAEPYSWIRCTCSPDETPTQNMNGGFLVFRKDVFAKLADVWPKWNVWVLDNASMLGEYSFYTDQISMTLALIELGVTPRHLPLDMNCPTHLGPDRLQLACAPTVLHHHSRQSSSGELIQTGNTVVDESIEKVNALIRETEKMKEQGDWGAYDLGSERLAWAMERVPEKAEFQLLVDLSREKLGWFPKHLTRCFEYAWALAALRPAKGIRALEIGAGVSPLPIALALEGATVVTCDNDPNVLEPGPGIRDKDSWGYLDYSYYHPSISSFHLQAEQMEVAAESLDAVYSISVIEHVPGEDRRQILALLASWTRNGGKLVLTIDLIPGGEKIWNRSRGLQVEDPAAHGSLEDLVDEARSSGFELTHKHFVREVPECEVDVAFLSFEKRAPTKSFLDRLFGR